MTPVLIVLGIVVFLVGWNVVMVRLSGRPWWNPLWMAFTLTAVAMLYGSAGLMGYSVPHNPVIENRIVWVGHVVWPQVKMAGAMALISVLLWTLGLKQLRSPR